ncbi:MAG TPA: BamA/TamA family outer membrane protein [Candidatus Limnocylindria bacterium]|nr:BamA/TamA family outer membrane protein [Candidatus Limnocylindria bacterium]
MLVLLVCLGTARASEPARTDRLSPRITWRVASVRIEGADAVSARTLRPLLGTQPRSWLAPWRERPRFDRDVLADDTARLTAYYRGRGYYHADVRADVVPDPDDETVAVTIRISEGPPVLVEALAIDVVDGAADRPALDASRVVPLARGAVFDEAKYDEGRARLLAWARRAQFARARVEKRARLDAAANTATVSYTVHLGPRSFFGPVGVRGLERVSRDVVLGEVAFEEGAPFDPELIQRTRRNLLRLRLFRSVTITEDEGSGADVPITIGVTEGPWREIRAGAGYDSVEQIRGLLAWRSYDFFGGARQLGFTARASFIRRSIAADFVQPHWPLPASRTRLLALFEDDEEDTFSLTQARLAPRFEWSPSPNLLAYAAYRIERDHLTSVDDAVSRALAPAATPRYATLSGLNLGLDWNGTDDLVNPSRGWVGTMAIDPVGTFFGGDADFVRMQGTLRIYVPLRWRLLLASRLHLGTITTVGDSRAVPIWERFYAGGVDSVRGYARWRVGPLVRDQPLGGRSLTEGSLELRHALTPALSLTAFVDIGQLSLRSFDLPVDDFQKGVGTGIQYRTPVGPVRLDVGFPLDRRGDDDAFQVYLSVGQTF